MRFPKNNKGFFNGLAFAIHGYWQHSVWIRWLLTPLITGVVPALTVAYYSSRVFGDMVKQHFPAFTAWLDAYAWLVLISAFIYPSLLIAIARFVMHRVNSNGINQNILLSLIAVLDRIVGCKAKRFGDYVAARSKNSSENKDPFETITQPQLQIAEITRGVCELFNVLLAEAKPRTLIKVVLAEIQGGKVVDTPIFFPEDEPVRVGVKILNQPESAIMTALRTKKMVIIESTKKELQKKQNRRYVASEEDDKDADCSLICFPIRHEATKSIPFVLSIHSDEAGVFRKENSELYEHLLGRFERRISLEYSLMKIKAEVANNEHN
jgi:hypothetical protein